MGVGFEKERAAYLCEVLTPERLTRIVDVGANPINENPYLNLLKLGKCDVWGFEPQPDAFAQLKESAGQHEHYLPYAVGSGGQAELRICKRSGFSSLLEPNVQTFDALGHYHNKATVKKRVTVETRSLDNMDEIPEFDLLKIDIQGGEIDVFEAATQKLGTSIAIITETAGAPIYVDQPLLDRQMSVLQGLGFSFHKFLSISSVPFLNRFSGRMRRQRFRSQFIDADAVFVRSILSLGTYETERLKHLAILADSVFDSQDLTVAAMAVLADRGAVKDEDVHVYLDHLPFVAARSDKV